MYYHRSTGTKIADKIAKETSIFAFVVPKLYSILPVWLSTLVETDKLVVSF